MGVSATIPAGIFVFMRHYFCDILEVFLHRRWRFEGTAALVLVALASCGPSESPTIPPLVLVITLDTLRSDHLGCYGYSRPTSPNLDAIAKQSTLYQHARSVAPWTLPAHASLFTGLYPFEHGARTYHIEDVHAPGAFNVSPLNPQHQTLAESFQQAGYRTAAFVANKAFLHQKFQADQGFEVYQNQRVYADEINAQAFAWIDQNREQPLFLFLNYMDTHRPFNTKARPGFLGKDIPEISKQTFDRLYDEVLGSDGPVAKSLLEDVRDQYDLAIANLDEQIGLLRSFLDERGLWDPALVLITSDHGEFFGEHRLIEHSKDVYEPVLRIPLLLKGPGQVAGQVEPRPISLVHLPRILLQHAQLWQDDDPAWQQAHPWPSDRILVQNWYTRMKDLRSPWGPRFDRVRMALYEDGYKYIQSSDGKHELYRLSADPEENHNLVAAEADRAANLAAKLQALLASRSAGEAKPFQAPLSDEELQALKELGYH
jgi:arylsulfatase A-like enzyme